MLSEVVERCGEIGTRYKLHTFVILGLVVCAVVILYAVVDNGLALLGVQLPRIAIGIDAVKVVNAICDVRGLLNLGNKGTCANRVDASCGQEEEVACVNIVFSQKVGDCVIGNACLVLLGCHLLGKSRTKARTRVGIYNIPHLGLSL